MALAETIPSAGRGGARAEIARLGLDLGGAFWTDDRAQALRIYWREGLSATQIAKELGGVSRNAVIGKVHRLGLAGRARPSRPYTPRPPRPRTFTPPAPRYVATAPIVVRPDLTPVPAEDGRRHTILTITTAVCAYPIGDPQAQDFTFCGRSVAYPKGSRLSGCRYCLDHARLAYAADPLRPRRRRRKSEDEGRRALLRQLERAMAPTHGIARVRSFD
jgi:GcrA cell cycle regulator